MVTNLKSWLRRMPQPHGIRYTTADEEERELQLSSNARNRWKDAAEALEEMGAMRVEALDKDGKVLRVAALREEDGGELHDPAERQDKAKAKEMGALAAVLEAQGRRINEAFREGADAASRGQENLVNVVNILTAQWSGAMNALQSLSMQLSKALRSAGGSADDDDDGMGQQLQQLLGLAAMRMMGGGGMEHQAPPSDKKNGAAERKK